MGSLYLIRHGQASFGQPEYDALSFLGKEQARLLGEHLLQRKLMFHRVVHGGMRRHQETAQLCLAQLPEAPPAEEDRRWNEFDHEGILRSLHPEFAAPGKLQEFMQASQNPAKAFHKEFEKAMQRWMSGSFDRDYQETWLQFKQRCAAAVQDILQVAEPAQNILVFTSGGPIVTLVQKALALEDSIVLQLNSSIVNASMTRLAFKDRRMFLAFFNDYGHFEVNSAHFITHR